MSDLQEMVGNWGRSGAARAALAADGDQKGLAMMLTGLGSLSYGELAGERIKLGLMLHDPEEEHDCFSDNTHNSHYYDVVGMRAVYLGRYEGVDGKVTERAEPVRPRAGSRPRGRRRDARGPRQDPGGVHGDQAVRRLRPDGL